MTFAGYGSGARSAVGIAVNNVMHGGIEDSSFITLATGVDFAGATDNSGWTLFHDEFYTNIVGIDCEITTLGLCNNSVEFSRFDSSSGASGATGDIMIIINTGNSTFKIAHNHFSCFEAANATQTAISDAALDVSVIDNSFEGCQPSVIIPQGTTGTNNGRALRLIGNIFNPFGAEVDETCTANGTTLLTSCTGTSLVAGMSASGADVETTYFVYGTGAVGTTTNGNTLGGNGSGNAGGNFIASVNSGSSQVTLTNAATGSGAATVHFCYPTVAIPLNWNYASHYAVVLTANTYINVNSANCGLGYDGN